jgi:hypothetical protein
MSVRRAGALATPPMPAKSVILPCGINLANTLFFGVFTARPRT